jgi:septal ring factor EnvC (AmiA/AmiB activator)
MKVGFFILFLTFFSYCFSQTTGCDDTTVICVPNNVAKEILIDLNRKDKYKEQIITYEKEIIELNTKIDKLESINETWEENYKVSSKLVKNTEEKVKLLEEDNKNLRKDISKVKTKNTVIEIVAGAIIGTLTYIILVK